MTERSSARTELAPWPAMMLACMIVLITIANRSNPSPEPITDDKSWQATARTVHAKFTGRKGTFAEFGDSISDTMAFWTPLNYAVHNGSPEMTRALETVKAYQLPECWREWKGPEHGNQSGQTSAWAVKNIAGWLKQLNPEVAVVLFGTNDLRSIEAP